MPIRTFFLLKFTDPDLPLLPQYDPPAISQLVGDGYVQTMQGKGVRNIYLPVSPILLHR